MQIFFQHKVTILNERSNFSIARTASRFSGALAIGYSDNTDNAILVYVPGGGRKAGRKEGVSATTCSNDGAPGCSSDVTGRPLEGAGPPESMSIATPGAASSTARVTSRRRHRRRRRRRRPPRFDPESRYAKPRSVFSRVRAASTNGSSCRSFNIYRKCFI